MKVVPRVVILAVAIASTALAFGCGGSEEPTSVSETDLQQGRDFWLSLDDGLQRELAAICQGDLVKMADAPVVALSIQEQDTDDYVSKINETYEIEDQTDSIEAVCEEASRSIAGDTLDELIPQLQKGN